MKRFALWLVVLILTDVRQVDGSIEFAEPDAVPVDTNLTTAFPGVTLSRLFISDGHIDFGVFARDSSPFTASTGTLLFGHAETDENGSHPRFWSDEPSGVTSAKLMANSLPRPVTSQSMFLTLAVTLAVLCKRLTVREHY